MTTTTQRFIAACSLVLGLVLAGLVPAHAAPAGGGEPPAAAGAETGASEDPGEDLRDPEALAELKRATDFLTALPRFQFKAAAVYDVIQDDGRRLQFEKHGEVYLQRPDKFFADVYLDNGRHRQFWYDGQMLGFAELSRKLHTQLKAPSTIDDTLDLLEELFKEPMPLADLLYSDLSPLGQKAFEADIVGDSLVDDRSCVHLAFRGETVDWQLWVDKGAQPFVRKLAISYREQPGVPQFVAVLKDWETPERFSDGLFSFTAPAGSAWVNILVPMPEKQQEGGQP